MFNNVQKRAPGWAGWVRCGEYWKEVDNPWNGNLSTKRRSAIENMIYGKVQKGDPR